MVIKTDTKLYLLSHGGSCLYCGTSCLGFFLGGTCLGHSVMIERLKLKESDRLLTYDKEYQETS